MGLGHDDMQTKLVPTPVAPQLLESMRVGRCHSLRPPSASLSQWVLTTDWALQCRRPRRLRTVVASRGGSRARRLLLTTTTKAVRM